MIKKYSWIAAIASVLLMGGAAAQADVYKPGEFLTLNVSQAALSPKPLGPPAQFEQVQIEAKSDPAQVAVAARPARVVAMKPRVALKKVARVRSNPLDANAADTRIQVWPCRSGGICNWQK